MDRIERLDELSDRNIERLAASLHERQGKPSQGEAVASFARMIALVDGITSAGGFHKLGHHHGLLRDANERALRLMAHMESAGVIWIDGEDIELSEMRQGLLVKQLTASISRATTPVSPMERHGSPVAACSHLMSISARETFEYNYVIAIFGARILATDKYPDAQLKRYLIKNNYIVRSIRNMNAISEVRAAIYGDDAEAQLAHFAMVTMWLKVRSAALDAVEPDHEKRDALRIKVEEHDRINKTIIDETYKEIRECADRKRADQAQLAHIREMGKAKDDQRRVEQRAAEREARRERGKPSEPGSSATTTGTESKPLAGPAPRIEQSSPDGQAAAQIDLSGAWIEVASWSGQVIGGELQGLLSRCTAWALALTEGECKASQHGETDWEDQERRRRIRIRGTGGVSTIERVEPVDDGVLMRTTIEISAGAGADSFNAGARWCLWASRPTRTARDQIDESATALLEVVYQSGAVLRDRHIHKREGHYPDGFAINELAAMICAADRFAPVITIRAAAARQMAVQKWISRAGYWAHVYIFRTHAVAARCAEITGQASIQQEGSVVIYSRIESGMLRMQTHELGLDEQNIAKVVALSRANDQWMIQDGRVWAVPITEANGDDHAHVHALRSTLEELEATKATALQLGIELQTLKRERADWVGTKMVADAQIKGLLERNAELEAKVRNTRPSIESWDDLEEWVNQAMSARVVLTKKAMAAARRSVYRDFGFAADVIDLLGTDYHDMREGRPGAYEKTEARKAQLGVKIGPCGEAPTTRNYGEEYRAAWGKRTYRLDMHVQGSSARERERGFRLYFAWDDERHVVVVGSMPEHLTIYAS